MSEESSSSPSGFATRPLHETLQPAVPLPSLLIGHDHHKQNQQHDNDSNTSLGESTATDASTDSSGASSNNNKNAPPGFNGTWRSESDMAERKIILKEIVRSVHRRRPNAPETLKKQLPMMVKKMEEALYKSAPSMEFYADLSTLEHRLEELAHKVQEQAAAMRKQQYNNTENPEDRNGSTRHYSNY
eukprot:CAMPEP_0113638364 /NCGR_PEP_ID=MMETSP0017_2-20120614/20093_1 /TAXON_ID=2856 /ORGANISM="Cylindrotheca closterium" /LENGTH=186 /DNA_ID=CAMNT_0000549459 /DNA_START=146 /DNA_END=707 /DNA_ORIENTATION=+ /assembly_acc=CAM_ASM_000147